MALLIFNCETIKIFFGTLIAVVALFALMLGSGCASKGVATRRNANQGTSGPSESWYIESKATPERPTYSCSFVEFDERGDYLDFRQQQDSWMKIRDLSSNGPILLVMYCHGWKNSVQSGDVVNFNHFLGRLAASKEIQSQHLRVHGLYLGWRGNQFRPYVDTKDEAFVQTEKDFGGPLVSPKHTRKYAWTADLPETLTYWSRKGLAEHKVSGVPLARTVFEAATAAKQLSPPGATNTVIVMGHSFGALMLEKAFGQASVGAITEQWPWKDKAQNIDAKIESTGLPVDCTLFINSAAPSIYAKEFSDFLWANEAARKNANDVTHPGCPLVVSVTSSADWATLKAHRYANIFAPIYPSLQRKYTTGLLDDRTNKAADKIAVPQAYFYEHTPGHNPLLVDHWIVKAPTPANAPVNDSQTILEENLGAPRGGASPSIFYTSSKTNTVAWKIGRTPDPPDWSHYKGFSPVKRGNYWIIRCDGELIASHTAIWTENTMELYAALFRLTYANPPPE